MLKLSSILVRELYIEFAWWCCFLDGLRKFLVFLRCVFVMEELEGDSYTDLDLESRYAWFMRRMGSLLGPLSRLAVNHFPNATSKFCEYSISLR